jgi:Ta0938
LKLRDDGCVLCGSTWGDHWAEIEGVRRFFCCSVCEVQFENLLTVCRHELGGSGIESLAIEGDRRGRVAVVGHDGKTDRFSFVFGGEGEVRGFRRDPVPPHDDR